MSDVDDRAQGDMEVRGEAARATPCSAQAVLTAGLRPRFLEGAALAQLVERLKLSGREVEIISHLFCETKESAIATSLGMSPHTLRTHVGRLYHKLHVTTRTELMVCLYECYLDMIADPACGLEPLCARCATGECPFRS